MMLCGIWCRTPMNCFEQHCPRRYRMCSHAACWGELRDTVQASCDGSAPSMPVMSPAAALPSAQHCRLRSIAGDIAARADRVTSSSPFIAGAPLPN